MAELTYREALRQALKEKMEGDPRVFILGEDVGAYGGAYSVTRGLQEEFGTDRVRETPIAESAIIGCAVGASFAVLLAEQPEAVVSRKELMQHLWASEHVGDEHACEVHISNLRRKIERDPSEPQRLVRSSCGRNAFRPASALAVGAAPRRSSAASPPSSLGRSSACACASQGRPASIVAGSSLIAGVISSA